MLYAYEQNHAVSYKGFRQVNSQINTLYRELNGVSQKIGNLIGFLCRMAGIDCEYYRYWLTGRLDDFAELVTLYLKEEERQRVLKTLSECKAIASEDGR